MGRHLILGDSFNQELWWIHFPHSLTHLTHLTFGDNFNQQIGPNNLPQSLTHLTLGKNFNRKITRNIIPNSLKYINLRRYGYEYMVDLCIALMSIEEVTMSYYQKDKYLVQYIITRTLGRNISL